MNIIEFYEFILPQRPSQVIDDVSYSESVLCSGIQMIDDRFSSMEVADSR